MLTYLRNLQTERDTLTATATALADTAATETRDLTDTERGTLESMQARCASIDDQLRTYSSQLDSTRAYAQLRAHLADDDDQDDRTRGQLRAPERRDAAPRSWGETFIDSDQLRAYTGHGTSSPVALSFDLRAAPSADARAAGDPIMSNSGLPAPYTFVPAQPTFSTPLLDLIGVERTTSGSVQWLYWTALDPIAGGPIAEGAIKPPANLPSEVRETALETYAHYKTITRQALEDLPRIQSIVETKLRNGLARRLEQEVGNAIDTNTDIPTVEAETLLGAIRVAQAQVQAVGYNPSAVALNPNDWANIDIELLARTLNGPVVNGNFFALRPIAVPSVPEGQAIVGDFGAGVTLFDRGVANVFITDSHADLFLRNTLLILAETRAKAVVNEPFALIKASAAAAATPGD